MNEALRKVLKRLHYASNGRPPRLFSLPRQARSEFLTSFARASIVIAWPFSVEYGYLSMSIPPTFGYRLYLRFDHSLAYAVQRMEGDRYQPKASTHKQELDSCHKQN